MEGEGASVNMRRAEFILGSVGCVFWQPSE